MKTISKLVLAVLIFAGVQSQAQDNIYFKDGKSIEAKILKVTETKVEYKKFSNLKGPTFVVGLNKIIMVIYENGERQNFEDMSVNQKGKKNKEFRRNRINVDLLTVAQVGRSIISYERFNDKGTRSLEYSFGMWKGEDSTEWVGYTVGVDYKFYTKGNGRGFYAGPSIGLGSMDWATADYYYGDYYFNDISASFSAYAGGKLGYQFQLSSLFGLYLSGTAGAVSNFEDVEFGYSANFGMNFSFN